MAGGITESLQKLGHVVVPGHEPLFLDDPAYAWLIASGRTNVFVSKVTEHEPSARQIFVMAANEGDLLFGFEPNIVPDRVLLVQGQENAILIQVPIAAIKNLPPAELAQWGPKVETWIHRLTRVICSKQQVPIQKLLEPGRAYTVGAGEFASAKSGVVWGFTEAKSALFFGERGAVPWLYTAPFPLSEHGYLQAVEDVKLVCFDTHTILAKGEMAKGLENFHRFAALRLFKLVDVLEKVEIERLQQRVSEDRSVFATSFSYFVNLFSRRRVQIRSVSREQSLFEACKWVAQEIGAEIFLPKTLDLSGGHEDAVQRIGDASNMRVRQVVLKNSWWKEDHGPLLGFFKGSMAPVALIYSGRQYEIVDVEQGQTLLASALAQELVEIGYSFYLPLPLKAPTGWRLLLWSAKGSRRDLIKLLVLSAMLGLLAIAFPISLGVIFDSVVKSGLMSQLYYVVTGLLTISVAAFLFGNAQFLLISRILTKMRHRLQSALIDRMLLLPPRFFRKFRLGDLAFRALGVDAIRRVLPDATFQSLFFGIFSVFSGAVLFYFNAELALITCLLVALQFIVLGFIYYFQAPIAKELQQISSRLASISTEMIANVQKIRSSGAERRGFVRFSQILFQVAQKTLKSRRFAHGILIVNPLFDLLILLVVSWFAVNSATQMSAGQFLAFGGALLTLLVALAGLAQGMLSLLEALPHYQAFKPILLMEPETSLQKADPGIISGRIDVVRTSFRYEAEGRQVLFDVNLAVEPGEFIAIVGPSGAGKSTLFRLMLGFEQPTSGGVFYDSQDLSGLKLTDVRRQLGVVLQNGQLFPGTILSNIIGSTLLTEEDAWEAVRLCGFDKDVEALPMGMQTLVSETAGGLSGGQKQLIMIARALIRKPKVVFFDEATSALDNRAQAGISRVLDEMKVTRVIVAHRLSTIRNAHRIYVVDGGKIVQSGNFEELFKQQGLFANLAKRQLI